MNSIFDDVTTARNVGEELIKLAALKDARTIMSTVDYSIYEKDGKPEDWETWKMNNAE